ncbi:MAG: LysR family transcriptional regulator, partial [Vibrio anguillarum]
MTLDQLLMFKTVAEAGSLKAASDKLHKTQPAISQSIKQLESQLDLILFNREGYRLAITEQGRKLLQHTQRVLNEA